MGVKIQDDFVAKRRGTETRCEIGEVDRDQWTEIGAIGIDECDDLDLTQEGLRAHFLAELVNEFVAWRGAENWQMGVRALRAGTPEEEVARPRNLRTRWWILSP